jgi:hypothetical protein
MSTKCLLTVAHRRTNVSATRRCCRRRSDSFRDRRLLRHRRRSRLKIFELYIINLIIILFSLISHIFKALKCSKKKSDLYKFIFYVCDDKSIQICSK